MTTPDNTQPSLATKLDKAYLVAELEKALRETVFTSNLRISPRRLNEIAQEVSTSFLQFLEKEDKEAARIYGQHLVQEGMGHRTILALTEALRRVCWKSTNPGTQLLSVSGRYVGALLLGYMEERETLILEEQERTVQALQRAQSNSVGIPKHV